MRILSRRRGAAFVELAMVFLFLGLPTMWGLFEFGLDTTDMLTLNRGVHAASTVGAAGFTYDVVLPASVPNITTATQAVANAERDAFETTTGLTEESYHMRITILWMSPEGGNTQSFVYDYGQVDFQPSWGWNGSVLTGPTAQQFPLRPGDRVVCTEVYAEYPALFQTFTHWRHKRSWEITPT